jgi:hypothetical protein
MSTTDKNAKSLLILVGVISAIGLMALTGGNKSSTAVQTEAQAQAEADYNRRADAEIASRNAGQSMPTTTPQAAPPAYEETTQPVQAKFPATNSEEGCLKIAYITVTRIEQISGFDSVRCSRLKANAKATGKGDFKNELLDCLGAAGLTYNRLRGRPDFDRLSKDDSDDLMIGCLMMINDVPERFATDAVKKVRGR